MQEIWKDVKDYEGKYQVSNLGNVRSLDRVRFMRKGVYANHIGGLLIPNGSLRYLTVSLCNKNCKRITNQIHRLVAETFLPNTEDKKTVNHKNGVKTDNRVENLEWMTIEENNNHAIETGLNKNCGDKNSNSKVVLDAQTGIFYSCANEAAIARGIKPNIIHSYLNGRRKNKTSLLYV